MSNRTLAKHPTSCPHCGGSLAPPAPAAPRRSAGSFADHDAFVAAFSAAAARATAECGDRWMLDPAARAVARVPAAWVNYRVFRRAVAGRRDMTLPAARFWPDGKLPIGPEYAPAPAPMPRAEQLARSIARLARDRDDALCFAALAARGIDLAAERRERERWIDAAHAAEAAMLGKMRRAAEPPADPANARLARKRRAHDARMRRDYAALPAGSIREARSSRDCHLSGARYFDGQDDAARASRRAYVRLAWAAHRQYLAALRAAPAPAAPAPAEPVAAPPAPAVPRQPVQRPRQPPASLERPAAPAPAADPLLLAWWHDAVASWRAYQSPDDGAALSRCQDAMRVLLAALPDRALHEHMIRAVKAGRQFPALWFAKETVT